MTHRFLVAREAIQNGHVRFSDDQAHQLRHVLRLRAGDAVRVFDGEHGVDYVVELSGAAEARIVGTASQAAEPRTRLVAYPALLQRVKFELVLQKLTELGVAEIVPVLTAHGLVREPPEETRLTRWRAILREATEQCGRGVVPNLHPPLPLGDAIARACADGLAIMAYEHEQRSTLRDALRGTISTVSVFVGPEGGYAHDEVKEAKAAGVRLITLGPRILRTETASPVLAALVLYELGDLSCGPT
ncbi:MAG: 16S rRNA (uracil(1498)-N(3))-methyltransferase [Chloroflexi bacterium]|nr:16S rRNA (uracil(1498)-N(3))-methyltransferase [Chloroflexota bacterium]